MNMIKKVVFLISLLMLTVSLFAQEQAGSGFTGVYENRSLVKLQVKYFVAGQWQERTEYGAIVSNSYSLQTRAKEEGTYLIVTGQQAVLPTQDEIDMFIPDLNNYEINAYFADGSARIFRHTDVIVADNGVSFMNFKAAADQYPVMINGESIGDVNLNNTVYIKNFKSSYQITPQFIDFSVRSSSALENYIEKNKSFITKFFNTTAFAHFSLGNFIMWLVAFLFIYLAIAKDYEPLLLLPIGFGILIGNIPTAAGVQIGIYDPGSVLNYLYFGVLKGIYPPLIFLGIGAMTDFSYMIANPKLILLGGGAQLGIFAAFLIAMMLGFSIQEAASIGIIGGADGPTAIFTTGLMAPHLLGAIAIAAYSYMALVPVIQPPVVKLLTTKNERLIRMKPPRVVTKREKIFFPIVAFSVCALIAPGGLPLVGMLLLGNIMKESGVTDRLAKTANTALIDIVTILIGLTVGASTSAQTFLTPASVKIFALGALSFMFSTAGGVIIAKFINLFLKKENKINPIIGCAGVSAVPDSARVAQVLGRQEDPENHLLMHAMAPNVAGVIGSAIAAGILLGLVPH